jgi:hypothetical protein
LPVICPESETVQVVSDMGLIVSRAVRFERRDFHSRRGARRRENLCGGTADEGFCGLPTIAASRGPTATSVMAKYEERRHLVEEKTAQIPERTPEQSMPSRW